MEKIKLLILIILALLLTAYIFIKLGENKNTFTAPNMARKYYELKFSDNLSSFVEVHDNKHQLIIQNGTDKKIIEEIENNRGGCCRFEEKKFSRDGKFLYYKIFFYEGNKSKVYSLEDNKIVWEMATPENFDFSYDNKFFYACAFKNESYGYIYSLPNFQKIFDLAPYQPQEPYTVFCSDTNKGQIRFSLDYNTTKKVEDIDYDIITGQVTKREVEAVKPFANLSASQLQKTNANIQASEGFEIVNSILSNKGDKIVYSEMKITNPDDIFGLEYNVFIHNIKTGEKTTIFSYPKEHVNYSAYLKNLIIKKALAGGSLVLYLPMAWTPNDQKIILEWVNPYNTGSGGAPYYKTFTVSSSGGDIKPLAMIDAVFATNYNKIIQTKPTNNSENVCELDGQVNRGSIILKNIETGAEKILIAEDHSYYRITNLDADGILTYTRLKTTTDVTNTTCGILDDSFPQETKTININNLIN